MVAGSNGSASIIDAGGQLRTALPTALAGAGMAYLAVRAIPTAGLGVSAHRHLLLLLVSTTFWPILPLQLVAGLLFGLLRAKSDSIGPSSLAHAVSNLAAGPLLAI